MPSPSRRAVVQSGTGVQNLPRSRMETGSIRIEGTGRDDLGAMPAAARTLEAEMLDVQHLAVTGPAILDKAERHRAPEHRAHGARGDEADAAAALSIGDDSMSAGRQHAIVERAQADELPPIAALRILGEE